MPKCQNQNVGAQYDVRDVEWHYNIKKRSYCEWRRVAGVKWSVVGTVQSGDGEKPALWYGGPSPPIWVLCFLPLFFSDHTDYCGSVDTVLCVRRVRTEKKPIFTAQVVSWCSVQHLPDQTIPSQLATGNVSSTTSPSRLYSIPSSILTLSVCLFSHLLPVPFG